MLARATVPRLVRALFVLTLVCVPWTIAASPSGASPRVPVIVQSTGGADGAERAVESAGGTVRMRLPIVDGVSASVPRSELAALRSTEGVLNVSLDAKVGFDGAADTLGRRAVGPTRKSALPTPYIPRLINATNLWRKKIDGQGVTVAVLDTGVYAAHPDLRRRVVHCEDFSHERGTAAECADTFGHGTFMAGLIAGNGAASNRVYMGAAPQAKIVSVKVAGFDGSTDISHILAGIQWIVAHKDAFGIRVLNLSLGSDSVQDYRLSPLNLAVERAWQAGIVAVVSAGNSGPGEKTIHKPADDPYVVTVGASNDEGTLNIADDRVPVFSSRGRTRANDFVKPDVVAPGVKTVSLRSPGSAIDQKYGATAVVRRQYFRGTGTSMSTAVTSGTVALMLDRNPTLNPDQVKFRLMDTARQIVDTKPTVAGQGLIDAFAAATSNSTERANQDIDATSTGLGSLEADRGTVNAEVVVMTTVGPIQISLKGQFGLFVAQTDPDIVDPLNIHKLVPWLGVTYAATAAECPLIPPPTQCGWDPTTWDATTWANEAWLATAWSGTQWRATVFDGTQWRGTQWRNEDWDAAQWFGTQWRHADWDGTQWRASTWQSKWYAAAWN
jgi:serine protease AprX